MKPIQKASPAAGAEAAAQTAIEALGWLAADDDRLERFLAVSGLGPQNLRQAAAEPRFLAAILDYLASNEALLVDFASDSARTPRRGGASPRRPARPGDRRRFRDPAERGRRPRLSVPGLPGRVAGRQTRADAPLCGSPAPRRLSRRRRSSPSPISTATPSTRRSKSATIPRCATSPLIVGGGRRGVVSTCCYIARTFGVRSAMPMYPGAEALPASVGRSARHGQIRRGRTSDQSADADSDAAGRAALDRRGFSRSDRLRRRAWRRRAADARAARQAEYESEIGVTVSIGLS